MFATYQLNSSVFMLKKLCNKMRRMRRRGGTGYDNTEYVDSNGEESLSEDNADDESDAENGSDIEVPVVNDDEVDDNDLTVAYPCF
jgi:hypothetical protein